MSAFDPKQTFHGPYILSISSASAASNPTRGDTPFLRVRRDQFSELGIGGELSPLSRATCTALSQFRQASLS